MSCSICNNLQEIADAAHRRREDRSFFGASFGSSNVSPQELEADAELAVIKADLAVLEHTSICEDCKRGCIN